MATLTQPKLIFEMPHVCMECGQVMPEPPVIAVRGKSYEMIERQSIGGAYFKKRYVKGGALRIIPVICVTPRDE